MAQSLDQIEKKFRPQLHWFLVALTWLSFLGAALLYYSFTFSENWRPSLAWWILTTAIISLMLIVNGWLVIKRLWYGSRGTWSLVLLMVAATPIVGFACYTWQLAQTVQQRSDLKFDDPTRTTMMWVSNYFELESRIRAPYRTSGNHVELFETKPNGTSEKLVAQMDRHIQAMAQQLNSDLPNTKMAWVRGSIGGQTARAIGAWAICDDREQSDSLSYLDKHENAHTLITLLSTPRQNPPMLLAEGWATSQSEDRETLIKRLQTMVRMGSARQLTDLVSDSSYGSSTAPAYNHGGPFVIYLLERFGGSKFLQLYLGVARETFADDVNRILGTPLESLETGFWDWLDDQEFTSDDSVLTFETTDVQRKWQQIIQSQVEFRNKFPPEQFAVQVHILNSQESYRANIVREQESWWIYAIVDDPSAPYLEAVLRDRSKPHSSGYLNDISQLPLETANNVPYDHPVISESIDRNRNLLLLNDLASEFQFDIFDPPAAGSTDFSAHINSIDDSDQSTCQVQYTERIGDLHIDFELKLDPQLGYSLIRSNVVASQDLTPELKELISNFGLGTNEFQFKDWWPSATKRSSSIFNATNQADSQDSKNEITIRQLTEQERQQVKQNVSEALSSFRSFDLKERFLRPSAAFFAWLALIGLLFAVDYLGERVKIRVPANTTH